MGVKGLNYIIEEKYSSHVIKKVSIEEMAKGHREKHQTKDAILVIDGMAVVNFLYKDLDWICGGQWKQYIDLVIEFVNVFKNKEIDLIFIFDGNVAHIKRNEWTNRRTRKMKEIEIIFQKIEKNNISENDFIMPSLIPSMTSRILKLICKCEVYTSIDESDKELAQLALNNRDCFAILSFDSDFLIFDTKPYLSYKNLNLSDLTTTLLDRDSFVSALGIRKSELPLLASLMGNDVISANSLLGFHRYLNGYSPSSGRVSPLSTIDKVVSLIKHKKWTGDHTNENQLKDISIFVFNDPKRSDLFRDSMQSYELIVSSHQSSSFEFPITLKTSHNFSIDFLNKVYRKYRNSELCNTNIMSLILTNEFNSSESLENCFDSSIKPSELIFKDMRFRSYCLLFGHLLNRTDLSSNFDIIIKEWISSPGNDLHRPELIKLNHKSSYFTKDFHNSTLLWLNERNDLKLQTFLQCLGIDISWAEQLIKVEKQYAIICCLLKFLRNRPKSMIDIKDWEFNAIISQSVSHQEKSATFLSQLKIPTLNSRAIHISGLLMKGISYLQFLNDICGQPFQLIDTIPSYYFDGKLFHNRYLLAKNNGTTEQLCDNQMNVIENYYHIWSLIKA